MTDNFQKIGDYISVIDNRNSDGSITRLMGISIDKCYIPSVANVIGTDLNNYKIIRKGQFACSLMQVSRDQRIPIAMYEDDDPAIMSPAYVMFEVSHPDELLPEYMELWFKRAEFDREASFYAVGGVRGSLDWEDFCKMELPVPSLPEQCKIVRDYQVITDRIVLLRQVKEKLEEAEQTILLKALSMKETTMTPLGDIADFIDGDRGKNYPTFDEFYDEGYCLFLSAANVTSTGFDFENCVFVTEEKDKAMNKGHLCRYDIVLTSRGTLGNVAFSHSGLQEVTRPSTLTSCRAFYECTLKKVTSICPLKSFESRSSEFLQSSYFTLTLLIILFFSII